MAIPRSISVLKRPSWPRYDSQKKIKDSSVLYWFFYDTDSTVLSMIRGG